MDEKSIYLWRKCEELNLRQAVLLISGHNPSNYEAVRARRNNMPGEYYPLLVALTDSIRKGEIDAQCRTSGIDQEPWDMEEQDEINYQAIRVKVTDLKKWLQKKEIKSSFFHPDIEEDFSDLNCQFYSRKLAASVAAWRAIVQDQSRLVGTSPKKAIEKWLQENKDQFQLSKEAINQIATIANWKDKGGAPATPKHKTKPL